jgi:imidazolonepropionase-like amidohydrolase
MLRLIRWFGVLLAIVIALYLIFQVWPLHNPHPQPRVASGVLAIQNAKIYLSPDDPPIESATLLMRDGKIVAFGTAVEIPAGAQVLACQRCVVTAGFWNLHVHFMEPKWGFAAWKGADRLNRQIEDMATSRGFTTVVDTGSNPRNTVSLRRRIETGDLTGPKIYTAGSPIYPPQGIPYYVRDNTSSFIQWFMPQPADEKEAQQAVQRGLSEGADIMKLFTGSWVERGTVLPMPENIAAAAIQAAHADQRLVFSHPSNLPGTKVAIQSGVDILAHAPDDTAGIDDALLQAAVDRKIAMVPTLKMFATTVTTQSAYLQPIYDLVRRFRALGGEVLFGTDVGYMTDYRTEDEFIALQACGLNAMDILRALTSAPAKRFGVLQERGTIAPGKFADLVVLSDDPAQDVQAFARVNATIRNGELIYQRP